MSPLALLSSPRHIAATAIALVRPTLLIACIAAPLSARAQDRPDAPQPIQVSAGVTVTNKGIATIPSFTLGKPAAIFDLGLRKGRVSFEPQFRFGLDGKPWSMLFWWRYRPLTSGKFRLTLGGHPAVSFRTLAAPVNGTPQGLIQARRYLASEVVPIYAVTPHVSVGAYYLMSHGIEPDSVNLTHFVASRLSVSNMPLSQRYSLQLAPQLYYLKSDHQTGVYLGGTFTVSRAAFPLSLSTSFNQPLRSDVTGGQISLWNVSANYVVR